jgi:hypothetical protein
VGLDLAGLSAMALLLWQATPAQALTAPIWPSLICCWWPVFTLTPLVTLVGLGLLFGALLLNLYPWAWTS